MKFPLIILAILHLHGITQLKDQTLIETSCRNTPNYELCVSTLHASPSSATATDVEELGLILVDAIKSKAESGVSAVDKLRRLHPELREALDQCRMSYIAVIKADVPEAVAALTKGIPKFAEFGMADAAWEAEICEGSFESAAESPLSPVNKDLHELATVAVGIIKILL
ncbi:hypothetical protein ACS0TY_019090 [Phlomoides rotata]